MAVVLIVTFVNLFVFVFNILLVLRVVLSYVLGPQNWWMQILMNLTEPLLAPVRRALPQTPGMDLSPLVTFLLLQGVELGVRVLLVH
ncbi:MAG TPA: YggT family protein [Candidatus Saccharimonas sp.]|nr:YggT family protein [Candidatus Saccharimonas sp.]